MKIYTNRKSVVTWLYLGVVMVFVQIIIGGITRLTGSGLSITRWDIVVGTLPPLSPEKWLEAFELYQNTPQYLLINQGMSLSEFKFIYFWEYIHRLWARIMGFVFLIPLIYFIYKNYFSPKLIKQLIVIFFLAALTASFGWIMVASGLNNQPWVSPYKLAIHLSIALFLFAYLFYVALQYHFQEYSENASSKNSTFLVKGILFLVAIQLFLGGLMSGMKAGLFYPTWPQMGHEWIPEIILQFSDWQLSNFLADKRHVLPSAIVQFFHRSTAYMIVASTLFFYFKAKQNFPRPVVLNSLPIIVFLQVAIGVFTVINCTTHIPLFWGVLHQAVAVLLLANWIAVFYFSKHSKIAV